jgi:hypothetical protein
MIRPNAGFQMPTKLPPEHHIVRNVPWGKLRKDDNDPEKVIGVLGEAFKMRPVDETLSTAWLEYFAGARRDQIYGAIRAMRASKLEIKTKSGFAIGKVGGVASVAAEHNYSIRVLHEPEDDNKAHVAVRRWPRDDMAFFEILAAGAWSELVLNNDPDIPKGAEGAPDQSAWTPPPGRE